MTALLHLDSLLSIFDDQPNDNVLLKCSCGCWLKREDTNDICSGCGYEGDVDSTFWHCIGEFNVFHPDGYDLCDNCALNGPQFDPLEDDRMILPDDPMLSGARQSWLLQFESQKFCDQSDDCEILQQYVDVMKEYNQNNTNITETLDISKISSVVGCYSHLVHRHDTDEEFAFIEAKLGGKCNVATCDIFRRHYRNMFQPNSSDDNAYQTEFNVGQSVFDKMHCYYKHSYEMGHRLSFDDKIKIYNVIEENKYSECDFDLIADIIKDQTPICICGSQMITIHAGKCYENSSGIGCDLCGKIEEDDATVYHCTRLNIAEHEMGYDLCVNCGVNVILDTNGNDALVTQIQETEQMFKDPNEWLVNKEILEINKIITKKRQQIRNKVDSNFTERSSRYHQLSTQDDNKAVDDASFSFGFPFIYGYEGEVNGAGTYNIEKKEQTIFPIHKSLKEEFLQNPFVILTKEQYLHELGKAKTHYNSPYCKKYYRSKGKAHTFKLENLLALMVYCNYDNIQQEFSKTYRINNGENHRYFYFWGKLLKISIQYFGKMCANPRLFHGIDKKIYLPSYVGTGIDGRVRVFVPLSTTSSFEVAQTFADIDGMVVQVCQFGAQYPNEFPCSWFSDYASEREWLFIQGMPPIVFVNVIELNTGMEYASILKATYAIQKLIDDDFDRVDISNDVISALIQAILQDRLSSKMLKYKKFESLNKYARNIIDAVFDQQKIVTIHYWMFRRYVSFLAEFFVRYDFESLNFQKLCIIFPNMADIEMSNVKLTTKLLDILVHNLSINNKLKTIRITNINIANSDMSIKDAIQMYSSHFTKLNAIIKDDISKDAHLLDQKRILIQRQIL